MPTRVRMTCLLILPVLISVAVEPSTTLAVNVIGSSQTSAGVTGNPGKPGIDDFDNYYGPFGESSSSVAFNGGKALATAKSLTGCTTSTPQSGVVTAFVDVVHADRSKYAAGHAEVGLLVTPETFMQRLTYVSYVSVNTEIPGYTGGYIGSLQLPSGNDSGFVDFGPAAIGIAAQITESTSYYIQHQAGIVSIIWSLGPLPGETPDDPVPSDEPVDVAGYQLFAPVSQSYGVGPILYTAPPCEHEELPLAADTIESAGAMLAPVYRIESLGPKLTTFVIPNALPGDSLYTVSFDGNVVPLTPGVPIDFTQYVPGGIAEFRLSDIDASAVSSLTDPVPFVTGLTFANEGLAIVNFTIVPEPSTFALAMVTATFGFSYVWRHREHERH